MTITLLQTCNDCEKVHSIHVTQEQLNRYEAGDEHVQDIFPELSADDRELLITGTCGACFDKLFLFAEAGDAR